MFILQDYRDGRKSEHSTRELAGTKFSQEHPDGYFITQEQGHTLCFVNREQSFDNLNAAAVIYRAPQLAT